MGEICEEGLQEQGEGGHGELERDVREVHRREGGKIRCSEGKIECNGDHCNCMSNVQGKVKQCYKAEEDNHRKTKLAYVDIAPKAPRSIRNAQVGWWLVSCLCMLLSY